MQIQKIGNQILPKNNSSEKSSQPTFCGPCKWLRNGLMAVTDGRPNISEGLDIFEKVFPKITDGEVKAIIGPMPENEAKLVNASSYGNPFVQQRENAKIIYYKGDDSFPEVITTSGFYLNPNNNSNEIVTHLVQNAKDNVSLRWDWFKNK
jgi:hypothetical protein